MIKHLNIKTFKHENKKAVAIIGGGLKKENHKWRTTNFDEGDNFAVQGDRLRVVAGSYLFKDNPKLLIIASAGKGQYKDISDVPTVAEVIKKELVEFGVPIENIIKKEQPGNTWQQLQEFKKVIYKKELLEVMIISNKYHLPRIKAMIESDTKLRGLFKKSIIKLQSAEEVCLKYDKGKWQKIIKDAYNSQAMKERIKLENKGVRDIKSGKYILK